MTLRVAIVGGGLGGLAAALFLRRAGIEVKVYEAAAELREVGAGIVVPPNMVRVLSRLGLDGALPDFAVRLDAAWEFRRWQDGRVLSAQTMGESCVRLYGTHCYVAHRADLLALLEQALPAGVLQLDRRCTEVTPRPDAVGLRFTDGSGRTHEREADIVIGADGIHSVVSQAVAQPEPQPARFSGLCAFRCLVPAADAPDMALRPVQTLWLGPGRHFVHYPISAGRLVNVVAIVPAGDWRSESWSAEGRVEDLQNEFEGWDPRLHQLIGRRHADPSAGRCTTAHRWRAGTTAAWRCWAMPRTPCCPSSPRARPRRWKTRPCSPPACAAPMRAVRRRRCSATTPSAGRVPATCS
jgi:salicylate hydroxylase